MPDYAVIENDTVVNVIIADSQEIAQAVSGDAEIIEIVNGVPARWWTRNEHGWITTDDPPYASWSWNYETHNYQPPTPMPDDGEPYIWNEDALAWEVFVPQEDDAANDEE